MGIENGGPKPAVFLACILPSPEAGDARSTMTKADQFVHQQAADREHLCVFAVTLGPKQLVLTGKTAVHHSIE
jgi:hypothetical protein